MIADRVLRRFLATRLIPIDPQAVHAVMGRFKAWAEGELHAYPPHTKVNEAEDLHEDHTDVVMLKQPGGGNVPVLIAFMPSDNFGGGFGKHPKLGTVVKIFYDARATWEEVVSTYYLNRVQTLLYHELTHAVDHIPDMRGQGGHSNEPSGLEDLKVTPKAYYNDPTEVRAYMRQLFEEIRGNVLNLMRTPMAQRWGLAKIITNSLSASQTWREMAPHLTSSNHNRILKGLVTEFEAALAS